MLALITGSNLTAWVLVAGLVMRVQSTAAVCRPADAITSQTVSYLQSLVTSTKPLDKAQRDSLRITARKASDVSYTTDESVCAKALTALNSYLSTPSASRQLYVFKIGTDFAVEDPTIGQGGEYRGLRIFDRKWVYKSTYLAN
jgi:hypothetical protein